MESPSAAPPAYFLSMTVENFRCFGQRQLLDLSDGNGCPAPWTIILGENGVGKTTLLMCLAALQSVHPSVSVDNTIVIGRDLDLLRATNLLRNNTSRKDRRTSVFEFSYYSGGTLLARKSTASNTSFQITLRQNGGGFDGVLPNATAPVCYGYGATRRMGKSSLSELRTEDTTASLFSDDVELVNAEEWLLQTDYAASKGNTQAAHLLDRIKRILVQSDGLLPDVTDLRFALAQNGTDAPYVEFQTPYGWVALKGLSLGFRTLITWTVDLASRLFDRYPNSPNPLAEPAVVLVDEIDLHLHPRWQRTLMQFLSDKFPNAQFIATAHSPLVVQAATDANIALLRREGDHVVIDNNMQPEQNLRVGQILTSDLFGLESARPPQIDKALAERAKILSKARLTQDDEKRLKELEAQIGRLPTGKTPEDMQAMDIIRRAAELLKTE
jgi:energy-coupling factor transporter ATP-binding protein EcfA2